MPEFDILVDENVETNEEISENNFEDRLSSVESIKSTSLVVKDDKTSKRGRKSLSGSGGASPKLALAIPSDLNTNLLEEARLKNESLSVTVRRILTSYFN